MSLTIDNTTHWKSSDIERLIRAAMKEADADPKEPRNVIVRYQKAPKKKTRKQPKRKAKPHGTLLYKRITEHNEIGVLELFLPKKGPKDLHPNAMVTLAAATAIADAGIDADTTVLAVSVSFFIANALVYRLALEVSNSYEDTDGKLKKKLVSLVGSQESFQRPAWGALDRFFLTKYKDPKLDGTYLDRVKKKKAAIKRAETSIGKAEKALKAAQKWLRDTKAKKKAAEKSLRDMADRRS